MYTSIRVLSYFLSTYRQCHRRICRIFAVPCVHAMPGGQLHVVFRKHSPFFTNLGQKYGPRSFQVNLIGHVALLTNHVFTSSRYCAGSSSGNCNWSSDELMLELPTSSRSILTVFLSESSSWPCKCTRIISTAARKLRPYAFSRLRDYTYGYLHICVLVYLCTYAYVYV